MVWIPIEASACVIRLPQNISEFTGSGENNLPVVFPADDRCGVRLFIVASQFRENLVKRNADGDCQAGFPANDIPKSVGNCLAVAEQHAAAGYVKPAFVNAERFHKVGVPPVDFVDLLRVFPVFRKMRSGKNQLGAFALCLPNCFGGLYAVFFGKLVFSKDDAVAAFRVAADSHGHLCKLRLEQTFHRGKKRIAIAVQNGSVHADSSSAHGLSSL
jgi:hypothetical protein